MHVLGGEGKKGKEEEGRERRGSGEDGKEVERARTTT